MDRILLAVSIAALSSGLCAQTHVIVTEMGDMGDMVAKAQFAHGTGSVNSVVGLLNGPQDVDIIAIRVTDPMQFRAETNTPITQGPNGASDTALYLLDCDGNMLAYREDSNNPSNHPQLWPGAVNIPLVAGRVYFIAVTSKGRRPLNAAGQEIFLHVLTTQTYPPNGLGSGDPKLHSWTGTGVGGGNYGISLVGAELLGSNSPSNEIAGLGCNSFELCPDTLATSGGSLDFTLTAPTPGIMAALARPGMTSFGVPLPAPVAFGCLGYIGTAPGVVLGITPPVTSHQFSLAIPPGAGFHGMPIAIQGARLDPAQMQVHTSNGLEATIGTCN